MSMCCSLWWSAKTSPTGEQEGAEGRHTEGLREAIPVLDTIVTISVASITALCVAISFLVGIAAAGHLAVFCSAFQGQRLEEAVCLLPLPT
jgi:hypothetical protein